MCTACVQNNTNVKCVCKVTNLQINIWKLNYTITKMFICMWNVYVKVAGNRFWKRKSRSNAMCHSKKIMFYFWVLHQAGNLNSKLNKISKTTLNLYKTVNKENQTGQICTFFLQKKKNDLIGIFQTVVLYITIFILVISWISLYRTVWSDTNMQNMRNWKWMWYSYWSYS